MPETMTQCPFCDGALELRRDRTYQFKFRGEDHVLHGLERMVCANCGAGLSSNQTAAHNEAMIQAFQREIAGDMGPADILTLREKYMMSQEQAARIFRSGRRSFSKWERGEVAPTAPTALLLRMALDNPEFMRSLAEKAGEVVDLPARPMMVSQAVVMDMRARHQAREREAYEAGHKEGARQKITVVLKMQSSHDLGVWTDESREFAQEVPMELLSWQEKRQSRTSYQS